MKWTKITCVLVSVVLSLLAGPSMSSSGDSEYEAELRRLESQIEEREIAEGTFRGLHIGHSKEQSLADLRTMGVQFIRPDLLEEIRVTCSEDLEKLRSSEGLILGTGEVAVSFDGDEVVRVAVAPIYPEWQAMLDPARNRDQVFAVLGKILDENADVVVRSHAPDAEHVRVAKPSRTGENLLNKYNLWKVSHQDDDGHWGFRLEFDQDRLMKIGVWHSPEEVP